MGLGGKKEAKNEQEELYNFKSLSFSRLNSFFESLNIQYTTPLMSAAKKHHTDNKNCVKKMAVIRHDIVIRIPSIWVLFMLEIKRGVIVAIR